jgi:hypothetical protein
MSAMEHMRSGRSQSATSAADERRVAGVTGASLRAHALLLVKHEPTQTPPLDQTFDTLLLEPASNRRTRVNGQAARSGHGRRRHPVGAVVVVVVAAAAAMQQGDQSDVPVRSV